ncbi:MAG: hypothetical protein U9N80_11600 [Chloroflexota bacterium]|nr:hypothetical protein [Chloroflexota bacterium]
MSTDNTRRVTITEKQQRYVSWTSDVLVYIVVLNLFVEFVDAIIIDSFWISILTAVLLKALLDIVIRLEHRVGAFFDKLGGSFFKFLEITTKFLILFTSKFIILEVVDFVFGDHVELGHFIDILTLIIAMMATKAIMVKLYQSLGESAPSEL